MNRLNRENCSTIPQTPGIYYLYNKFGKLLYIGRGQKLRHRLQSWYQADKSRPKWKRELAKKAYYFSYATKTDKKESMKHEKKQIKKNNTKFNHYSRK